VYASKSSDAVGAAVAPAFVFSPDDEEDVGGDVEAGAIGFVSVDGFGC
jgi:hypothetical protein